MLPGKERACDLLRLVLVNEYVTANSLVETWGTCPNSRFLGPGGLDLGTLSGFAGPDVKSHLSLLHIVVYM